MSPMTSPKVKFVLGLCRVVSTLFNKYSITLGGRKKKRNKATILTLIYQKAFSHKYNNYFEEWRTFLRAIFLRFCLLNGRGIRGVILGGVKDIF